jgi:ribosomal protein S18 acetylase RimI-like enzyme
MLTKAGEHDAERIARLHIASWQATYTRELSPAFLLNQDLAAHAAEWRRRIADHVAVLIAEEMHEIAGFVSCGPAKGTFAGPGEWEIYNLHVARAWQGKGLGSELFGAAAALGLDRGARELVLWVVKTNGSARAFYERKGMRWDGGEQERALEGEVLHEVRYRLNWGVSSRDDAPGD